MMEQSKSRIELFIERSEPILMLLAFSSVILYLTELQGIWDEPNRHVLYTAIVIAIDILFLCDIFLKTVVLRARYLSSPWFLIDLISTLPALGSLFHIFGFDPALRAIRGFRFLRTLRGMRSIRLLQELRLKPEQEKSIEKRKYHRALISSVVVFGVGFVLMLRWIYAPDVPLTVARQNEFFLVLGSILGLSLLLFVVRFQMPAMSMHQIHQLLNVALPKQVAEHFLKNPTLYHQTVRMPATVVFCDLQGFTTTVEQLGDDLVSLKKHLEQAMDVVVQVHIQQDLIVDKFIGDAIMSFRGGNLVSGTPEDHAYRVVRASIDSIKAFQKLNDPYFTKLRIGGSSSSCALIGAFGTSHRLSYTILGDRVNLAARLEGACKKSKTDNLFCEQTYLLTQNAEDIVWRRYGILDIRGKSETIIAYEALDTKRYSDWGWLDAFHQAVTLFEQEAYAQAVATFEEADALREGGDPPAQQYRARCLTHLQG